MTSTEPRRHDERRIGEAIERTIARLLTDDIVDPTAEQIRSTAAEEPLQQLEHVYRLAALQRLVTGVTIYFRVLAPDRNEWHFVGHQHPLERMRGDLLFENTRAQLRLDELKTGTVIGPRDRRLNDQVNDLLQAGVATHGERFVGVRALLVCAPMLSFVVNVDGTRSAVLEGLNAA